MTGPLGHLGRYPTMPSNMKSKLVIPLVFATLLATVSGCSRVYLFDGLVVDGDGQPIAGATIIVYPHDWERPSFERSDGTSDDDGSFEANWGNAVGVEYFRMVVSKDGYKEHERLVEADARDLRIVMERAVVVDDSTDTQHEDADNLLD